jgi:hypothetical protein
MVTQAEVIRKSEVNTRVVSDAELRRLADEATSAEAVCSLAADALEHLEGTDTARMALYGAATHLNKLARAIEVAGERMPAKLAEVAS